MRLKPTKARLTAFNISSIDIRITIRLRRVATPITPIVNRIAERPMT